MTTRKEKVLELLTWRARGTPNDPWVVGWEITKPQYGGSEGLRRLRELKDDGHRIEKRKKENSSAYEYRIVLPEHEGRLFP